MRKHLLPVCIIVLILLIGCDKTEYVLFSRYDASIEDPTGFPPGQYGFECIMVNDKLYMLDTADTSYVKKLPKGYSCIGKIEKEDSTQEPDENWEGCHIEAGSEVYGHYQQKEVVFVQYGDKLKKFHLDEYGDYESHETGILQNQMEEYITAKQGEMEWSYVKFNNIFYTLVEESQSCEKSELPKGYERAGVIEVSNNYQLPTSNGEACHIEKGSRVYVDVARKDIIYVEDKADKMCYPYISTAYRNAYGTKLKESDALVNVGIQDRHDIEEGGLQTITDMSDIISEDADAVYYWKDGKSIVKKDKKTSKEEVIFKPGKGHKDIRSIEHHKDKLYIAYLDKWCESVGEDWITHFKISCVDMAGSKSRVIVDGKDYIRMLKDMEGENGCVGSLLKDGVIYYKMDDVVCSLDTESEAFERVSPKGECIDSFIIKDEYLYYNHRYEDTFTIYRMNMNSGETEIVLGNGVTKEKNMVHTAVFYHDFLFIGDTLYVETRNPFGIVEYKDGKETRIVDNEENGIVYSLSEYNGILYYMYSEGDNGIVKSYNPATGEHKVVVDDAENKFYSSITFLDGYIYYYQEVKSMEEHSMVNQLTCKKLEE